MKKLTIRKIGRNQHGIYFIPKYCRNWRYFRNKIIIKAVGDGVSLTEIKKDLEKNEQRWWNFLFADLIGEPINPRTPCPISIVDIIKGLRLINENLEN